MAPTSHITAPAGGFIVVMGVSGCGKTAVAQRLAEALGGGFVEADLQHSAENVARMHRGIGLTDADRWPWLAAVCAAAKAEPARPALKRSYRDFIRARLDPVRFVFLDGPAELIAARLKARSGHFATSSLLDSQLATLEPPVAEERAIRIDVAAPIGEVVAAALTALSKLPAAE